jgi:hypothetical protein
VLIPLHTELIKAYVIPRLSYGDIHLEFEFKALNAINQEYVYYLHVWRKKRQN